MTTETTLTPQERIEAAIKDLGLSLSYKFVPFSMSRNKDEKHKSLNWVVTLKRGSASFSTEYSAGCGYCPANKTKDLYLKQLQINKECEEGFATKVTLPSIGHIATCRDKPILPSDADVISSLVLDASVLDEPSFESWADNLGYDTDSRKAEAVYKACLEIALKLRAMIGDAGLRDLQEACQDY